MMKRKRTRYIRVLRGYVDGLEAICSYRWKDIVPKRELAGLALDGDLPNARGAHDDPIARVANGFSGYVGKTTILRIPPNECMRIEEQIHVRDRSRTA